MHISWDSTQKTMENQNTEWKLTWKDEYLKWICGFANAHGGTLYIGCDDHGKVVGVAKARKLLEDIPNKVRDVLGILADVDLLRTAEGAEYLCINVQPSLYPVNCKGEYHYRTGSTKQQLQGGALTQFLMQRAGSSFYWDAAPVAGVSAEDLDPASFAAFRKGAVQSGRMTEESASESNTELLKGLGLIQNGSLTRAAVLLFHSAPERWFTGACTKIAFFPNDADIAYMDEIHGSLFTQAERIIDILYLKYLKGAVSYSGINRVETYPFPRAAVREAILNALVHTCYASGIPMQIRVYEDKLYISNSSCTMEGWTLEKYMHEHRSEPYNPALAATFFRAGLIESWGRGIEKICKACTEAKVPVPVFQGRANSFMLEFHQAQATRQGTPLKHGRRQQNMQTIVELMRKDPTIKIADIAKEMGLSIDYMNKLIAGLRASGKVEREEGRKFGRWLINGDSLLP